MNHDNAITSAVIKINRQRRLLLLHPCLAAAQRLHRPNDRKTSDSTRTAAKLILFRGNCDFEHTPAQVTDRSRWRENDVPLIGPIHLSRPTGQIDVSHVCVHTQFACQFCHKANNENFHLVGADYIAIYHFPGQFIDNRPDLRAILGRIY
jgi:hypothetical protein